MTDPVAVPVSVSASLSGSERCAWCREQCFLHGTDITASFGMVSAMLEELACFLKQIPGLDGQAAAALRLVCDELASNAARHVSPRRNVRIRIEVLLDSSRVHLRYWDDGSAFDPLRQTDPYVGSDLERRTVGGLGLYLIGRMFPEARYSRHDEWNLTEVECGLSR